jgi:hypothetical protein
MPELDEELVRRLTRRAVELRIHQWPTSRDVGNRASNGTWRRLCQAAGGDTPECYEASSRADKIVSDAREAATARKTWKDVAAEAVASLPVWEPELSPR